MGETASPQMMNLLMMVIWHGTFEPSGARGSTLKVVGGKVVLVLS